MPSKSLTVYQVFDQVNPIQTDSYFHTPREAYQAASKMKRPSKIFPIKINMVKDDVIRVLSNVPAGKRLYRLNQVKSNIAKAEKELNQ